MQTQTIDEGEFRRDLAFMWMSLSSGMRRASDEMLNEGKLQSAKNLEGLSRDFFTEAAVLHNWSLTDPF